MQRAQPGGKEALRRRPAPGRAPRLNAEQREQLPALLAKGAEAYGFRDALWTRKRVAQVIRREFGVSYSPRHVGRLLKALDWTVQQSEERATQRDEAAIQQWVAVEWPRIKKGRRRTAHGGLDR